MAETKRLARKAQRIKMLLLDVDGVMTDGGIYYSADGVELKRFHAQDGYGIARALDRGISVGIISGRSSPIVELRAKELHIDDVFQNADDKVAAMKEVLKKHSLSEVQTAFIGDDLFDLPLLKAVGLSAAPNNARTEVKRTVDIVTKSNGGEGAVRELIDFILKHQKT